LAVCVLALLAGCGSGSQTPAATPVPSDEYQVYRAVIDYLYFSQGAPEQLVIQVETESGDPGGGRIDRTRTDYIAQQMAAYLDPVTLADFAERSQRTEKLKDQFGLPVPVRLLTRDQLRDFFSAPETDGWERFFAEYPGAPGTLALSQVGFNEGRTQAMVYAGQQSGWLSGSGNVYLLNKTEDGWRVVAIMLLWIS
jgi:hypothetical protein